MKHLYPLILCVVFSISSNSLWAQTETINPVRSTELSILFDPEPTFFSSNPGRMLDSGAPGVVQSGIIDVFNLNNIERGPETLNINTRGFYSTEESPTVRTTAVIQVFGIAADEFAQNGPDGSLTLDEFLSPATSLGTVTVNIFDDSFEFSIPVSNFLNGLSADGEQFAGFRYELVTDNVFGTLNNTTLSFPSAPPILRGDVNLDGMVTFLDISPFIEILASGEFQDEADINLDGEVSFLDIAPFIAILSGQSGGQ